MTADLVLLNGSVFTATPARAFARAVAVTGDRITYVGSGAGIDDLIGGETRVVDLAGRLVTPGFQDAHVHPGHGGLELLRCSLAPAGGAEEAVATVAAYLAANPDVEWVRGGGWSQDWFPRGCPAKELLDRVVPDRPAILHNRDGHSAWVNSVALSVSGIDDATPDPPDGRIERNPDGTPQGTLHEGARYLVLRLVPDDSFEERREAMLLGQRYLLSKGITAWQDAHVDAATDEVYRALATSGELEGRVVGAMWWERRLGPEQIADMEAMRAEPLGWYRPHPVKLMLDGVVENHTARFIEPYHDPAGGDLGSGIDFIDPRDLAEIVTRLDALGFSCHFHAIGDGAVRNALDAVETARLANGWTDNRHHIAHIQVIHPDDIPRFGRLGVAANAQALWASDDGYQPELTKPFLGPVRSEWQYPFASLLAAGAVLAMGSDWSVSTADVFDQAHVAVTRTDPDDPEGRALVPGEAIRPLDALTGFTAGSAYVNHLDGETGTIEVGKLADLAVMDRDPLSAGRLAGTGVSMTVIGGRVVFEEEG